MPEVEMDSSDGVRKDMRGVLPVGTTLRGYELKSVLGRGGFGITYRARDITLGRDVAVKEYLPTALAMREGRTTVVPHSADHAEQFAWGRERFLDEARTLARLDHTPAIVRVHDFLEANGTAYMVMALIDGETLAKRLLREQHLTPEAIERLVFPLLDGMEEIQTAGFLHRDIKPANIMVDARGRPTLIDFGASRAAMAERSTTLTAIFTPGYAAVEQFTSAKLGPWTDIYGLAATLYHAITGRIPPSAIERILKDIYEPLSDLQPPGYPAALLAGIDAGLAVRVEDRPQDIAEWRHMLRSGEARTTGQEATHVARKPVAPAARAAARRTSAGIMVRGPALWGAAAAAILLVACGGYFAWQANAPASVGTAALSFSTEQLEQALAERRKADALAAEKRQLEDAARRKAEAETEANRQAVAELELARRARQKAEDDLAKLKADIAAQRQAESGQREQAETTLRRAAEEAAQRKAEDEAEGLRLAEEEAKRRAVSETETKRLADEALVKAEAERQRAEQEARLKTEAEATAMRQASEDTQRKALEAETRRQAEEAQAKAKAEREKADAEAKAKAEADKAAAALARQKEEAEAAEKGLRLEPPDRERLQVALTSLGFDTRGSDGILGRRSREMIAAWQKARNQPVTGFLTAAQQQALLKEAAPALSKYDEQKKADEDAKVRTASASPGPAAPVSSASAPAASSPTMTAPSSGTAYDGAYSFTTAPGASGGLGSSREVISVQVTNGRGSGTISARGCDPSRFSIMISPTGNVSGEGYLNCVLGANSQRQMSSGPIKVDGGVKDRNLVLTIRNDMRSYTVTLSPGAAASSSLPSPDGLWRGAYQCGPPIGSRISDTQPFSISFEIQLVNGSGTWKSSNPTESNGSTYEVAISVGPGGVAVTRLAVGQDYRSVGQYRLAGQYDGKVIGAARRESPGGRECTLELTRV